MSPSHTQKVPSLSQCLPRASQIYLSASEGKCMNDKSMVENSKSSGVHLQPIIQDSLCKGSNFFFNITFEEFSDSSGISRYFLLEFPFPSFGIFS